MFPELENTVFHPFGIQPGDSWDLLSIKYKLRKEEIERE